MAYIPGFPTNDVLTGTPFDDLIKAFAGDDEIVAGQGNDRVFAGDGNDYVDAGDGNDTIYGGSGVDRLYGGTGSNYIYGGTDSDLIVVGDPNFDSENFAFGGRGHDFFLAFDRGDHSLYGGAGIDTMGLLWFNNGLYGPVEINMSAPTPFARTAAGPEVAFSGIEQLMLIAGAGDDTVTGGRYGDALYVSEGNNLIDASGGDDLVEYITDGTSTLEGGAGNDTLSAMAADFALYFVVGGSGGAVDDGQLSVITGFEQYQAIGGLYDDFASLGTLDDKFVGNGGNDTAFGMDGNDSLQGDSGRDSLNGGAGNDTIWGGGMDDTLDGGDGNDLLRGGFGADQLDGGDGNDRLIGGKGADTMTGGNGADRFVFNTNENDFDLITDFETGVDLIRHWTATLQSFDYPNGEDYTTYAGGYADSSFFSVGAAVGNAAQFVLIYHSQHNETWLHWDSNGENPAGGTDVLIRFTGEVTVVASDILLF